jgi:phosphoglycerate dehydrogenase-like enzyme
MKKNVLFAMAQCHHRRMFHRSDLERIERVCRVLPVAIPETADKQFLLRHVGDADIVVTSWGSAALDEQVMAEAGRLELLAHAGGTVKPVVSDALWSREVRVTSAAAALAFGVAEFCLGLMLTASKRAFWAGMATREGKWSEGIQVFHGPQEIYQQNVGIIGASHVGRQLARLLKNFTCNVLIYDPYCTAEHARALGARKVDTLEELFSECMIVSLNAPMTDETRHMIRGRHVRLLRPGALFINTARGPIVEEHEMIAELKTGRFVACLDVVTEDEPPAADNPLRHLPNVWLTPHEAGAVAQNLQRIGTFVANEIEAFVAQDPLHYEVKQQHLAFVG